MSVPIWTRKPFACAAQEQRRHVLLHHDLADEGGGAMRAMSKGSGSPSFIPSGVALTTRS
jgi:hypothetical protein